MSMSWNIICFCRKRTFRHPSETGIGDTEKLTGDARVREHFKVNKKIINEYHVRVSKIRTVSLTRGDRIIRLKWEKVWLRVYGWRVQIFVVFATVVNFMTVINDTQLTVAHGYIFVVFIYYYYWRASTEQTVRVVLTQFVFHSRNTHV